MSALVVWLLSALVLCAPVALAQSPDCPVNLTAERLIEHDFAVSFCELCDIGTVRMVIQNPFRQSDDADFADIVVRDNLNISGLTYLPGSTRFSATDAPTPPLVEPSLSGPNNSILTWTLAGAYELPASPNGVPNATPTLAIEFDVRRVVALGEEGLVGANRTIEASVEVTPSCDASYRLQDTTGPGTLPLREPLPQIIKRARNVDAGQSSNQYSDPVYGHENDDVIWRIELRNNGEADLQDFRFRDTMQPGNFEIDYVCDSEGDANSAATGGGVGNCQAVGGVTDLPNVTVATLFGGGPAPYVAAPAGGSGFYYLVGRVTDSCTNRSNTVSEVEWGCEVQAPPGGIGATSTGLTAQDDALLSTQAVANTLDVDVALRGANTAQPMGGRGTVTITISNNTGGTIIGGNDGIELRNVLPTDYVIDTTFAPTVQMAPAYGTAYPGMLDTIEWTNPQPGTFPLTTIDPALPLANTTLEFTLTSSTVHPVFADQFNMLRHGDVLTVTFRTVLIDPQYYDREAYLDERDERPASDPPNTDPVETFPLANQLEIWFEEFCTNTRHYLLFNDSDDAEPEDLDVDISGSELIFILTNTDELTLTAELTNNGGHDADDYFAYVSFGQAMEVRSAPAGCISPPTPPLMPEWQSPVAIPATATTYQCDVGVIGPGVTRRLDFVVAKNPNPLADDDLTFRVDVIGEIRLSDGTPLWFPTPLVRGDGVTDRANNYTIDAVRARVVGYNLLKSQQGVCSENNPPPGSPDSDVQIGEECEFFVQSGGWFGFLTPGFTYIAVQDVQVVDQIPDGQGYISSTDPFGPGMSTVAIQGVSLNPPPLPLSEAWFDWTFNTVVPDQRITEKDHWFRVDVTTRLLNDPLDDSLVPNVHAAQSRNVLSSTFEAVFFNPLTNSEELYTLGPSTVGFPPEFRRRVDLTVTEPSLSVVKEVCNETIYGIGPACSNFVPLADDGDAFDSYVFRITVSNQAAADGVTRAPAYDVTVTSDTDPTDLIYVAPLASDGLDNDGNAQIDEVAGEGQIVPDNDVLAGSPAQIVTAYDHSDALLRIDAGDSVVFYYRVDPYDDVAPLQQLTNSAYATYDTLAGPSGNQTAPLGANGDAGGARQYVSASAEATIQIIPVEVQPKQILRLSNTPPAPPMTPQAVSIGEEIEFGLRTLIPVAQLRDFVIRDELPAGMRCVEAPVVDLDAPPYDAAGFMPGGSFTATCTDTEVVWNFGTQTVTQSPRADRRFDFGIQFIARVDNAPANRDGTLIGNGGAYTVTNVTYIDQLNNPVMIDFEAAEVIVREPSLALTKTFSAAQADAGDELTVTVTATNDGTAPAYNPRVLDALTGTHLIYAGGVGGTHPPTSVDVTTYGSDSPLFVWDPGFAVAVGEQISFTFVVRVADDVQPLAVIDNTVQADWTSLPGQDSALNSGGSIGADGAADGMRNGALPSAGDTLNDYESQADASFAVPPLVLAKTDLDPGTVPTIGAHKSFEVQIDLPEGISNGVTLGDDLGAGSASYVLADNAAYDVTYEFNGIASINGQAPAEAALNAVPADGANGAVLWDIGTVATQTENDSGTPAMSPYIRVRYAARINNDTATNGGSTLQNSATLTYLNGETAAPESLDAATAAVTVTEPALTATKAISNVTPGKAPGDPIALGDIVEYVLTIPNVGDATAREVNIVDTLPPELALQESFTPVARVDGLDVAGFVGLPAGAPGGPLVWGAGNGDASLDVAPGATLEVTYRVQVIAPADQAVALTNIIWVDWTSQDDGSEWERTGAGCPAFDAPNDYCFGPASADGTPQPVGPPDALLIANDQPGATIGEPFRYRVTVPAVPYALPLYDVRVQMDLGAAAADLVLVGAEKVTGSGDWTPVNAGSPTDLVIGDAAGGIDIPLGEQVTLELVLRLADTPTNVRGLTFGNSASYIYNRLNDSPATQLDGSAASTAPMVVIEPEPLIVTKTGPAQMQLGVAGTFTLDVHNQGDSPAYDLTLTDVLPDGAGGGLCDTAPANITAGVFEADGTTAVSPALAEETDFRVEFAPAPDCTLRIVLDGEAVQIGAGQRLIVTYQSYLDLDSEQGTTLTNVAGATEWHSIDTADANDAANARAYTRVLTDGTTQVPDHEDAHEVLVFVPVLVFEKTVANLTRGEDPAVLATPGDRLRYRLRVENAGDTPLEGFRLLDELDSLNPVPLFRADTLTVVTAPEGADLSATDAAGGAAGTGLLDIGDLSLGGPGESVLVEFEVELAGVIANETPVYNQSQLRFAGLAVTQSDDPGVNGAADPAVPGDEDPTLIRIESAPALRVQKTSSYISGDPNVLLAGETLRYTLTVQNVGTDNATGVRMLDQVPANTTYVPGSTTLNGATVADAGGPPLAAGLALNAPQDDTVGVLNAQVADNVATLTFDVVVDPDAQDATVISNQAFVSADAIDVQPSDDPRTPVADDPTRDIVGNFPLLFAPKSATLQLDLGSPGIVDPGDVLRYTITVYNNGRVPATAVQLFDSVPGNTAYVPDSVTLNGVPLAQPDDGVFPLIARLALSSAGATPPLPAGEEGVLGPQQSAVVQFDLRVNDGVATGTLITNQAVVYTAESPNLLTDGDGNPSTGPEPTVVVVGDAQQLSIIKQVAVAGGGRALPGATLEYAVSVRNIGAVPAREIVITDDLNMPNPGYLTYVEQTATMNGQPANVSVMNNVLTANYAAGYGALEPGGQIRLRFLATIDPDLALGTTLTNTAQVRWNDPPQTLAASALIDVGAMPDAGMLSGHVWHDANHDNAPGDLERPLEGWTVDLLRDGKPIRTVQTDTDGYYLMAGVQPNYAGEQYSLRYRAPGAGSRTATLGDTQSRFTDDAQRIDDIVVRAGSNVVDLYMPVDPHGVIYDSVARVPVSGATVSMIDVRSGLPIPAACFDDPNQQEQVTVGNGYYKFDLNFSDPACPPGINYLIRVAAPDSRFVPGPSELIPAATNENTVPFDVASCPGSVNDAVPETADYCEAQRQELAPTPAVSARDAGTGYYSFLRLGTPAAGARRAKSTSPPSAQLFNNHIPLDPRLGGAVAVTKTTPKLNVSRGQMVPYVIGVRNSFGVALDDVTVVDRFPPGFRYVEGSARLDDAKLEPSVIGRQLLWPDLSLAVDQRRTIKLLLAVGAGVTEGEFINRAQAVSSLTGTPMSPEAEATVRLVPDPTFDCTDLTGKVFDDANRNARQDNGETGLSGVRVVTATGLAAVTDAHGRYHVTCAITPNESRGSNFVIKLDDRTLPSGFRASTRPVQVQRATRGKALRINFGASIHHVVGLDLADAVFEPGTVQMRSQWLPRLDLLLEQLQKAPSVLRLSYVGDVEPEALAQQRLAAIKQQITSAWKALDCCYELIVEPEIFWRLGAPPGRDSMPPGDRRDGATQGETQ